MHLKQKGRCFVVFLLYTIVIITSSSQAVTHVAFPNDQSRAGTAGGGRAHPTTRGGKRRLHVDPPHGGRSRGLVYTGYSEDRDGAMTETSEGMPGQAPTASTASTPTDRRFKNRVKVGQSEGKWMYFPPSPSNEACTKGQITPVTRGKFYITGEPEANVPNISYQADSVDPGQERTRGQRPSGSEEIWRRLQPVVECSDYAMTLTVRRRRAVQLLLDQVNGSSVPLSQLPPQCGYSVQTTWKDLSLMAPYDACHVTQEDDRYVLPLLWRGTPVKMSCPTSQIQSQASSPPSVCCSPYGMTVKVHGLSAAEVLRANVRGEWTPLVVLAEQCGYSLDSHGADVVFAAPFITCGITVKDGKYILSLQIGEKIFTVACPVSPPEEPPLTQQPLGSSTHPITRGPVVQMAESLEPFPWAPPFYLAPAYYPHPTYSFKYPGPHGHDVFHPSAPSPMTPDPTFGPHPPPPVGSHADYQEYFYLISPKESYMPFGVHSSQSPTLDMARSSPVYSHLQPKQEIPVLGVSEKHGVTSSPSSDTDFLIPVESPSLQLHTQASNQYYHYYHHPKIPLSDPPQDPDLAPEVTSLINSHNPDSPVLPRSFQHQSDALSRFNSDPYYKPDPESAAHLYTLPTNPPDELYPPQPYTYHHFPYFPHMGEVKKLTLHTPDTPATKDFSDLQNTKSSTIAPMLHSSDVHNGYNTPDLSQPNPGERTNKNTPDMMEYPPLSDGEAKAELKPPGPDAVSVSTPEQPAFPNLSPSHNLIPYPYYYHPYYYYYQMYYGPESLLGSSDHVSPASSKEALDPLLQASSSPPQHPSHHNLQATTPTAKPVDDFHHGLLHPYYYYYPLYYQPKTPDDQEVQPAGSITTESQFRSDYSWMGWLAHAAGAGYPSMSQTGPFYNPYPNDVTEQQSFNPTGHPDGEPAEDKLENEMRDCTLGQHFIFAVPDSVVEATVPPPAQPTQVTNMSCTLQKLTSDPDIYIVPLDGCGITEHNSGEGVGLLMEVPDVQSFQQDHSSVFENSPFGRMVGCYSSPHSPGQVMDQPHPPAQSTPAVVTVQLRIATDGSFISFHPEAHLPLSLIRGRPVYVEVSLLDPPEPGLVLLVHSCLAYAQAAYISWMLVYDGCPSRSDSQLLPSPRSDHIRRIVVSSFLSLPSDSPTTLADEGYSPLEDPEVFFVCLTQACSAVGGNCTVGCINSPNREV